MKKQLIFLYLLLLAVIGYSQNIDRDLAFNYFDSLSYENPSKVIGELSVKQQHELTNKDIVFLTSKSLLILSEYLKVDSTINNAFTNYNYSNDSTIYYKTKRILSISKKVQNEYESSFNLLLECLSYFKKIKNTKELIGVYIDLAEYHRSVNEPLKGFPYILKTQKLIKKYPTSYRLKARFYNRYASLFGATNPKLDSTKILSLKAISLAKKAGNSSLLASSYNELGYHYYNLQQNELSQLYYDSSLFIRQQLSLNSEVINSIINKARSLFAEQKFKAAIELLKPLETKIASSKISRTKSEYYYFLSNLYNLLDSNEKAYQYLLKHTESNTEFLVKLHGTEIAAYKAKLAVTEKEKTIGEQQKQLQGKNELIEFQEKNLKLWTTLFTLLAVILALAVITAVYQKRTKNTIKAKQIQIQNLLKVEEENVKQKEVLMQELNHRVKNNLEMLSSMLEFQVIKSESNIVIEQLNEAIGRIKTISEVQKRLYTLDQVNKVQIHHLVELLLNQQKELVLDKEISVKANLQEMLLDFKSAVPFTLIINELVTNTFKYGFLSDKQQISVQLGKEQNRCFFSITDNGPGFDANKLREEGVGLFIVNILLKQLNGSMNHTFENNLFTTKVTFII